VLFYHPGSDRWEPVLEPVDFTIREQLAEVLEARGPLPEGPWSEQIEEVLLYQRPDGSRVAYVLLHLPEVDASTCSPEQHVDVEACWPLAVVLFRFDSDVPSFQVIQPIPGRLYLVSRTDGWHRPRFQLLDVDQDGRLEVHLDLLTGRSGGCCGNGADTRTIAVLDETLRVQLLRTLSLCDPDHDEPCQVHRVRFEDTTGDGHPEAVFHEGNVQSFMTCSCAYDREAWPSCQEDDSPCAASPGEEARRTVVPYDEATDAWCAPPTGLDEKKLPRFIEHPPVVSGPNW
jgi:hypothetical protein